MISMREAVQDAAKALRRTLVREGPVPARFGAALAAIPPEDRDAWFDLVWDVDELPRDDPDLPRGCVPYLPCPIATVLEAVTSAAVTCDDVFVDVGAGLGRALVLTHLLTGAGCIGLEIQSRLVQAARGRAAWLNLDRVRFIDGDAADLVRYMAVGTVFFLYCPFGGRRLERVLDDLEAIARTRQIRVCCVGIPPLNRPSFVTRTSTSADLAVYWSTPHRGAFEVAKRPHARG